jgi:uncharacterized membrane protein
VTAFVGLGLAALLPFLSCAKTMPPLKFWSFASICSLCFLKHLYYDYVFLVIPLSYALSDYSSRREKLSVAALVIWFWYLAQPVRILLDFAGIDAITPLIGAGFLLNIWCLIAIQSPHRLGPDFASNGAG